jgi:hypothetical protein
VTASGRRGPTRKSLGLGRGKALCEEEEAANLTRGSTRWFEWWRGHVGRRGGRRQWASSPVSSRDFYGLGCERGREWEGSLPRCKAPGNERDDEEEIGA